MQIKSFEDFWCQALPIWQPETFSRLGRSASENLADSSDNIRCLTSKIQIQKQVHSKLGGGSLPKIPVADLDAEKRVDNNLVEILKLKFCRYL